MEVVEIYNEEVYDLLQPDKPKLLIVDHPHKGNVCSGSNELIFTSAREGVDIVQRGLVGRAVRACPQDDVSMNRIQFRLYFPRNGTVGIVAVVPVVVPMSCGLGW